MFKIYLNHIFKNYIFIEINKFNYNLYRFLLLQKLKHH